MRRQEKFIDISTGARVAFSADSPDALIRSVQKFRNYNGVRITDEDTAKEIGEKNGYVFKDGVYSSTLQISFKKPSLTLASVKSACGAMMETIKGNIVSDQEINRRWEICKNCPVSTKVSDCMSCGGAGRAADWVNKIKNAVGKRFRLEQESGRTFCGLCGCSHALMIPTKMKLQKQESEKQNQQRPSQCWLRWDSNNYVP